MYVHRSNAKLLRATILNDFCICKQNKGKKRNYLVLGSCITSFSALFISLDSIELLQYILNTFHYLSIINIVVNQITCRSYARPCLYFAKLKTKCSKLI